MWSEHLTREILQEFEDPRSRAFDPTDMPEHVTVFKNTAGTPGGCTPAKLNRRNRRYKKAQYATLGTY